MWPHWIWTLFYISLSSWGKQLMKLRIILHLVTVILIPIMSECFSRQGPMVLSDLVITWPNVRWYYVQFTNKKGRAKLNSLSWVTHVCISKLTIIGSDNGLSPGRPQAIIWTNSGILLIGPLRIKFNEILIKIHTFPFKEMYLKLLSAKWQPFCLGLNVLKQTKYCWVGQFLHDWNPSRHLWVREL